MKYTSRKRPAIGSSAAAEVRTLLKAQSPPLANNAAATMIGVNYETMRAVTNDFRVPSPGIIYGLARALKMDEKWIQRMLELRAKDMLQKKIEKVTARDSGREGIESMVAILEVLNAEQIKVVRKVAQALAISNRELE